MTADELEAMRRLVDERFRALIRAQRDVERADNDVDLRFARADVDAHTTRLWATMQTVADSLRELDKEVLRG